jgi:hypothetical protein
MHRRRGRHGRSGADAAARPTAPAGAGGGAPFLRLARVRGVGRDERGAAGVMIILLLSVFFIIGYLAVNAGVLVASRTAAQRAADAATLAGCWYLPDQNAATLTATDYANVKNSPTGGTLEGGNSSSVTFASGGNANLGSVVDTIRVEVTRNQRLVGVAGLGVGTQTIRAHARCVKQEGFIPLLLALASGPHTLDVQGGSELNLGAGAAVANSTSDQALRVFGSAVVNGWYLVTGSGEIHNTGTVNAGIGQGTFPDPYANVQAPQLPPPGGSTAIPVAPYTLTVPANLNTFQDKPGCQYQGGHTSPRQPNRCAFAGGTAEPGIYWGGMELGPGEVTLRPGMYFLAGGGGSQGTTRGGLLVHAGTVVRVQGTGGVIIFNGFDPYAQNAPRRRCGPLEVDERAQLLLTPTGAAEYQGLIFFQDRQCDERADIATGITIGVKEDQCRTGMYFPAAMINFQLGNAGPRTLYTVIVADKFDLNATLNFECLIPAGTLFLGKVRLVE